MPAGTIVALLLASGAVSIPSSANADTIIKPIHQATSFMQEVTDLAEQYGVKKNLALGIMRCESGWNSNAIHYNRPPDVIYPSEDIGYWQINDTSWYLKLKARGWNIYKPLENLEAGFWMLKNFGTGPWDSSKFCWD